MSKENNATGKVYLVGAGPGDPGLITVKGLNCIRKADVLIYDRLVNHYFLKYAPSVAELIYVGKLPDRHTLSQEKINHLLVEKAQKCLTVVRLKGGDPYVFGRGGEEAEFLAENQVPFEVVPGIVSAVAVPAYAGIPVTHRTLTSNFAVITGHEDPTKADSSIAWDKIATGLGTLIFLMGVGNLSFIVEKLLGNARSPQTPVALIRWGTRSDQDTLVGSLEDIVEKARVASFKSPAIIVVGEVVSLRKKLQWFETKPLFGCRIVVTRSREQASVLSEKIIELGGEPFEFPTINIAPPLDYSSIDTAIASIEDYSWIIFTSVNAVASFFDRLRYNNRDVRDLKGLRLAAIGPRTKESLEEKGLLVEYMPAEYRAEAILEHLTGDLKTGEKVLLPRSDLARKIFPETLRAMGAVVDDAIVYRTLKGKGNIPLLRQLLLDKMIHIVTFTSSSTVRNFTEMLGDDASTLLKGVTLASIGPITTKTAQDLGLDITLEADEYTIDGLVKVFLSRWNHSKAKAKS